MRVIETQKAIELEATARRVGELLENGALLIPTITGTSKSNLSYRYKVMLAYDGEDGRGIDVLYLSYWLASELGVNLTDNDEIKGQGVGFDRYHDVAYTIAEILRKRYGFDFSLQKLPKFVRGN
jgi:hypothetical protein